MTHRQRRAIVIEDDVLLCRYFQRQLSRAGIDLQCIHTGRSGLESVRADPPDLVLLGVSLTDIDGFDVCRRLKADSRTKDVPVVFVSALGDCYVKAFQAGAVDCITKPIRGAELQARVNHVLKLGDDRHAARQFGRQTLELITIERPPPSEAHPLPAEEAIVDVQQMLGVIGHELRTPLTGLRVMAEYLMTETNGQDPHHFLRCIHDETVRMSTMVNNLLEAARLNSGAAQWSWGNVSILQVCRAALNLMSPLVDENIRLICDVQPEEMTMLGDASALERLLLNLVGNAQKHSTSGTISVHARSGVDGQGSWVELRVADTGAGIAPAVRKNLGVPFALSGGVIGAADSVGSGLGLSICETIAAAHGGKLSIESKVGEGTTVTTRLRAHLHEAAPQQPDEFGLEEAA